MHKGFVEARRWHFSSLPLSCLVISFTDEMPRKREFCTKSRIYFAIEIPFIGSVGEVGLPLPKLVASCMCMKFHPCPQRRCLPRVDKKIEKHCFLYFLPYIIPTTCLSKSIPPILPTLLNLGLSVFLSVCKVLSSPWGEDMGFL